MDTIAVDIFREYPFLIKIIKGQLDITDFYDPGRRQYNANELLKKVDEQYGKDESKTIGIFNVDIFITIFTYIFGQAFLNGRTGIVSGYRLSNERYGIEPDPELFRERFTKEIINELGHTFGLIHCLTPDCVMRSGTYVEDIDQKNAGLCPRCQDLLLSPEDPGS